MAQHPRLTHLLQAHVWREGALAPAAHGLGLHAVLAVLQVPAVSLLVIIIVVVLLVLLVALLGHLGLRSVVVLVSVLVSVALLGLLRLLRLLGLLAALQSEGVGVGLDAALLALVHDGGHQLGRGLPS
jgi:hypothetical protein